MPAVLTGPTTDPWHNAGAKYIKSGVTRGTTTASGLLFVDTGFPRLVFVAQAWDEGNHFRNADGSRTQSTFFMFNQVSTNPTLPARARFRVIKCSASSDMNASFTIAAITSGVTAR